MEKGSGNCKGISGHGDSIARFIRRTDTQAAGVKDSVNTMITQRGIQGMVDEPQPKVARVAPPSEYPSILHQLPMDLCKLILCGYLKPKDTLVLWMCNRATRRRVLGCVWKFSLRYPTTYIGFTRCVISLYKWAIKTGNMGLLKWLTPRWAPTDWIIPRDVRRCCKSEQFNDVIEWLKGEMSKIEPEAEPKRNAISYGRHYRPVVARSAIKFGRSEVVLEETIGAGISLSVCDHNRLMKTGNTSLITDVLLSTCSHPHQPMEPNDRVLKLEGYLLNISGDPVRAAAQSGNLDLFRELIKQGFTIGNRALLEALLYRRLNITRYLLSKEVLEDVIDRTNQIKYEVGQAEGYAALLTGNDAIIDCVLQCDASNALTAVEVPIPHSVTQYITAELFSWYIATYKKVRGHSPPIEGTLLRAIEWAVRNTTAKSLRMAREMVDAFIASDITQARKDFGELAKSLAWGFHLATLAHLTKAVPPSAGFSYDAILANMIPGLPRYIKCKGVSIKPHLWHMAELLKHEYDCDVYAFVSDDVKQRKV